MALHILRSGAGELGWIFLHGRVLTLLIYSNKQALILFLVLVFSLVLFRLVRVQRPVHVLLLLLVLHHLYHHWNW